MLSIISFIGLLIGILLAKLSPEELKPGKKYFILLKKIILIAIVISIIYYSKLSLFGLFIGAFIGYFFKKEYFYFGLALVVSLQLTKFNILLASLIFIYSLPYGTLLKKNIIKEININLALFLLPLLFLINNLYLSYDSLLSSFIISALIVKLIKNEY